MESGTVKLTPQWLSFTNNQPQGEDRRGSHSNNDHRERYDRGGGGGRYGGFSSSKTSQYPFSSERSKPVSISPAPSNGMGYPSADSGSKPAYTKQQSFPKRDEGYLHSSQSQPHQISAPAPAPAPTDAQEYPLRLSSPPQPATIPPKSSYDKNFPSLYGNGNGFGGYSNGGSGSGSNLKKSRYFDDDSVSLGQSSPVQNQSKQAHKPTPQAPLSTSPPPGFSNGASSGFGKPQQKWTSESNGLGVTKSISAAPSPPITNGAGASMNTYPTPGGSTLVSPAPTQVTTAAVLRSASPSPTPKIPVQPSPTPPPKSPSPTVGSPPPPTVKVPAAIIREAPKPAVKSSASQQAQPGAPSIELERAKSLVPTQPIVPKPLTKNRGDLSSKQSKQFGQAKGGRGGAIMSSQTQLLRGGPIKKTELEGAKFDSNPPVQEEGESSEPVKPATPSPAKVLPRNNFFNSLRKQEEQKKNGSFIQSSSSGSNATSSAAPADTTTAESESEQSSSQKDDGVATPPSTGIATEPEVVTTPTAVEVEAETTATPTTTTTEKEAADESSGSDSATMIDLPEEEEQRLLKAFGWTPPDSEEEEELCIPDEEIQALRTQLDQHKQNFNQQREIRLLSLAQSVEQWQQRLFSSPTLCPIKSPN